jgi:ABC-2 type transport system permease protein
LALYGLMMVQFYGTIVDQREQFEKLLDSYPKEMVAFFGNFESFVTPSGYLGIEYFSYMPLILGVFAVLIGSGLLASDEESGRLDLVMAHPVSRTALFWGRLSAFGAATLGILFLMWLGIAIPSRWTELNAVSVIQMAQPFASLFAVLMLFATLALLFSLVMPSRRMAAMTAGILLVASFLIVGLANINADLKPIARLSPLNYYDGGEAINNLNIVWLVSLLIPAVLFALLAWWQFERRDIRVGGEGAWQLPATQRLAHLLPRKRTPRREVPAPETVAARR